MIEATYVAETNMWLFNDVRQYAGASWSAADYYDAEIIKKDESGNPIPPNEFIISANLAHKKRMFVLDFPKIATLEDNMAHDR